MKMIGKLKTKRLFLFVWLWVMSFMAVAEVSVTSEISTTSLALNQSLTYKLIIRGASNAGNIDQRIFKDFVVVSQSTSQNYSFINGAFESSITKFFTLKPRKIGTLSIPEATVVLDNQSYTGQSFTIQVTEAVAQTQQPAQQPTSPAAQMMSQMNSASQFRRPSTQRNSDMMLLAESSKSEAYVGEEIIYRLFLLRQISILADISYSLPEFKNIMTEQLERNPNTFRKDINGQRYYIQEIDKRSLFSYESGAITIPPSEARMQVSVFYEPQTLKSNDITLNILPLPKDNVPNSFTGLVGDFQLEAKPLDPLFIQNKPTAIRFVVKGSGNLKKLTSLSFAETDSFKIYQSSTDDYIETKDSISGERHFEYIVVPRQEGVHNLPMFTLSYFSPTEKQYKTIQTNPIAVDVVSAAQNGAPVDVNETTIERLTEDLGYLKPIGESKSVKKTVQTLIYSLLLIINSLFLLVNGWFYLTKQSWFNQFVTLFTMKSHDKALKHLSALDTQSIPAKKIGSHIQQILLDFLSAKLAIQAHGLVYSDLAVQLKKHHYSDSTIQQLTSILEACSFMAYSPENQQDTVQQDLIQKAKSIIKELK